MQARVNALAKLLNAVLSNPVTVTVSGGLVMLVVAKDDKAVVKAAVKRATKKAGDVSFVAVDGAAKTVFVLVDDSLAMSKTEIKKLALLAA